MTEKLVADALASGEWKEKVDANRGNRKYYVNTKTKKSVWDLAKELQNGAGASGQEKAAKKEPVKEESHLDQLREDRLQKARKRAEAEAQINLAIANLERQKVDLETEIARLQGPLEQEAAAIALLKREVDDARGSMQTVAKDTMQRRRERNAELHEIRARVQKIETTKENELQHIAAVKERHNRLQNEASELRQDLLKEQATAENLRTAVRESQKRLDAADAELTQMKSQIGQKEQLVFEAEQEVISICKKRAETEANVEKMQQEVAVLRARLQKRQRAQSLFGTPSTAQPQGTANPRAAAAGGAATHPSVNGGGAAAGGTSIAAASASQTSTEILAVLSQRVQSKKRILQQLAKSAERELDVATIQHQNMRLSHLAGDAKRDAEALQRISAMLKHETQRTVQLTTEYKAKCLDLKGKVDELHRAAQLHDRRIKGSERDGEDS